MILIRNFLCIKVSIGDVALQSVPLLIIADSFFADIDLYVLADFEELVIATPVHLCLGQPATAVCLAKSGYTPAPVVGILLCPFVGIPDYQPFSVITLALKVVAVSFLMT